MGAWQHKRVARDAGLRRVSQPVMARGGDGYGITASRGGRSGLDGLCDTVGPDLLSHTRTRDPLRLAGEPGM